MMITGFVVALALCAVVLFYMAVRSRRKQAGRSVRPVDLNAFRALMDREDELFMKSRLSRSKFFHLKRQRIRVVVRYVARIAANASAVLHVGEAARMDPTPEVAYAATQVMELAGQIRIQCLLAISKLVAEYMVPSLQLTPDVLVPKYLTLRENVKRLGALQTQHPAPLATAI
jgi:hypothetical protein